MKALRFAVLFGGLLACPLAPALEWDSLRATIWPDPFDQSATVSYRFKNTRNIPVHITSAYSTCGCTVPHLAKLDYAPGESGELTAVFTLGQVIGDKTRQIIVTTDEPAAVRTTRLTLEARVPKVLEVGAGPATWRVGERPGEKTIPLTLARADVHPVQVEARDPRLRARIDASGAARGIFQIVIAPTTTAEELYAPVLVTMNFPATKPRVVMVYARVVGKEADGETAAP